MPDDAVAAALAARLLAMVARRVGGSLALDETLDAVAAAVVDGLGFRAAVVNLVDEAGDLHVVAIAGSDALKAALHGTHASREAWDAILAACTRWGDLRFMPHDVNVPDSAASMAFYVPSLPDPPAEGDRWHPEDALFAPLIGNDGELLGVLSVDDPVDGRLPTPIQRAMLEAFAVQAALAIEHAREHNALRDSQVLLQQMFDESPIGKALFDADGRYARVNRAYCDFMGRPAEDFVGRRVVDFAHPDELDSTAALSAEIRYPGTERMPPVVKRYLRADGMEMWGRLSLARIGDAVLAAIEDVTDAKLAEEQLRHSALHDSLTGLPNRVLLFDRLAQAIARARRDGSTVAVVAIDVDHFKAVNDTYGHPAGDQLLTAVADALRAALREGDTAGRLGGDEFAVVCEGISCPADAVAVAERLQAAVRVPVQLGPVTLLASASLGVTVGGDVTTPDQLVAEADAALYRAKAGGRARYELFDEEMRASNVAQHELRRQLTEALAAEEFVLHYQPIVDLTGGHVVGYEALLRWQHPVRGLLPPAEFLPVIVEGDLDVPVTQWVLRRACADIAAVTRATGDTPFVSVNLSARQLSRPELVDDVQGALRDARMPAKRLWLEITEEHLVDRRHRPVLDRLSALGCRVALDDFGTGYSGLTYLQQMPVNILKIDREFVGRVGTDRISSGITAAMTDLAEVLGIRVVAEGVETAEQAELLAGMGINLAQGFYYARPAPIIDGRPVAQVDEVAARARRRPSQPFTTVKDSMTTG